ncbi:hypothetical protein RIF23_20460 [Lipingzhangella sp. LS1_29]|uniref:Transcriptional regulator n=1 Tax=Lipingzhangella rawalii TaxID=2055835 RepID=A0ABU2HBF6_9ACTN|nr:hypothetical protein [Lipingzhangella rawalii]MDS1272662.1 hypothetical protein [Lipingzhangella rawalii]
MGREPNYRLAALLGEAGWSPSDLARAVGSQAKGQGRAVRCDRTSVAHWLSGSRPRHPLPSLAAAALSRRLQRLVAPSETGLVPLAPAAPFPYTVAAGGTGTEESLIALCRQDIDRSARPSLTGLVYSAAALELPGWQADTALPVDNAPSTAPELVMVREMTRIYAALFRSRGGKYARSALAGFIADDVGRLLAAPLASNLRRAVLAEVARLVHVLATMSADAGYSGLAERYFHTALGMSRRSGDQGQYAVTLRAMSSQALSLEHFRLAERLATSALETAPSNAVPMQLAYLLAQYALIRARSNDEGGALAALEDAEERLTPDCAGHDPFEIYPRAGLDYLRGEALLALGRRADAQRALTTSLSSRPDHHHRPNALTHSRLAEILLRDGLLEESCRHWNAFLRHYPHLISGSADRSLDRLRSSLLPFASHPQVSAVLESGESIRRI